MRFPRFGSRRALTGILGRRKPQHSDLADLALRLHYANEPEPERSPECLSDDTLRSFLAGTLGDSRQQAALEHLADCKICTRREVELSGVLERRAANGNQEVASWGGKGRGVRLRLLLQTGAFVSSVVVIALFSRWLGIRSSVSTHLTRPVGLQPGPVVPGVRRDTVVERSFGKSDLPRKIRLWDLRSVPMGPADAGGSSVKLVSPFNTFVTTQRPIFRWTSTRGAKRAYVVTLLNSDNNHLVARAELTLQPNGMWRVKPAIYVHGTTQALKNYTVDSGTSWNPWQVSGLPPLQRGVDYEWNVSANPAAPPSEDASQTAHLLVVDAQSARDAEGAKVRLAKSPANLGELLASRGLIEEARREFLRDPGSPRSERDLGILPPGP